MARGARRGVGRAARGVERRGGAVGEQLADALEGGEVGRSGARHELEVGLLGDGGAPLGEGDEGQRPGEGWPVQEPAALCVAEGPYLGEDLVGEARAAEEGHGVLTGHPAVVVGVCGGGRDGARAGSERAPQRQLRAREAKLRRGVEELRSRMAAPLSAGSPPKRRHRHLLACHGEQGGGLRGPFF